MRTGDTIGALMYKLLPKRRHIAEVNIALCYPELSKIEQANLVKAVMQNAVKGLFEMALSWWASPKRLEKLTRLEGQELLAHYRQSGRGVILLGMHYTTIELAGATISLRESLDITYKAQKGDLVNAIMDYSREQKFDCLIEKNAMRTMLKRLKQGQVIWYAPDQDFGRKGSVFPLFFNTPAATIPTLGKLAQKTRAKVLMYGHFRETDSQGKYYYQGRIFDPEIDQHFGDNDTVNAGLMNQAMQTMIQDHPAQYNWLYQRFRTRPERHEPKLYPKKKKRKKIQAK